VDKNAPASMRPGTASLTRDQLAANEQEWVCHLAVRETATPDPPLPPGQVRDMVLQVKSGSHES